MFFPGNLNSIERREFRQPLFSSLSAKLGASINTYNWMIHKSVCIYLLKIKRKIDTEQYKPFAKRSLFSKDPLHICMTGSTLYDTRHDGVITSSSVYMRHTLFLKIKSMDCINNKREYIIPVMSTH